MCAKAELQCTYRTKLKKRGPRGTIVERLKKLQEDEAAQNSTAGYPAMTIAVQASNQVSHPPRRNLHPSSTCHRASSRMT